jgi:hypothetical protein
MIPTFIPISLEGEPPWFSPVMELEVYDDVRDKISDIRLSDEDDLSVDGIGD